MRNGDWHSRDQDTALRARSHEMRLPGERPMASPGLFVCIRWIEKPPFELPDTAWINPPKKENVAGNSDHSSTLN